MDEDQLDRMLDYWRHAPRVEVLPVRGQDAMLMVRIGSSQHYWYHDECREIVKKLSQALP